MDHQVSHEHQSQKTLSHQNSKAKFLKQATKLLLSVSVFSLFFSHSTWFSLPMKLISHNLDKSHMFLICNGLLVFLAKFSGLLSSTSSSYSNHSSSSSSSSSSKHNNNLTNEFHTEDNSMKEMQSGDHQTTQENADHQQVKGETEQKEEQEVAGETKYVIEEEDDEQETHKEKEKEPDPDFNSLLEVEEEREEQNGMLSTEELNKKFEDFIRKIKEELKIEARQQLVMV